MFDILRFSNEKTRKSQAHTHMREWEVRTDTDYEPYVTVRDNLVTFI